MMMLTITVCVCAWHICNVSPHSCSVLISANPIISKTSARLWEHDLAVSELREASGPSHKKRRRNNKNHTFLAAASAAITLSWN